jgi:hypothetical protein
MQVTIMLTTRQVADIVAQLTGATVPKPKRAAKPRARAMTEHRRNYQKLLMRKRRAAAKAETASTISTA